MQIVASAPQKFGAEIMVLELRGDAEYRTIHAIGVRLDNLACAKLFWWLNELASERGADTVEFVTAKTGIFGA